MKNDNDNSPWDSAHGARHSSLYVRASHKLMSSPRLLVWVPLIFLFSSCSSDRTLSPLSPSDVLSDSSLAGDVLEQWSPYVGIHLTGEALDAYRDAVLTLRAAGQLDGVRVELGRSLSPGDPTYRAISRTGVELLGLISNEHLFLPNIEQEIDRIFETFPEIRHFQIGNEVTTILPSTGPTLTIEQYMTIFLRIYDHVQSRHAGRAILLTQSTAGSGVHGPTELEAMVNLGLTRVDPSHVIIAINMYDLDYAGQFVGLLGGQLRRFRLWVTESGTRDQSRHMTWVRDQYPRLRNLVRAERVYWYVMWGGDSGSDTDFSLIKNPSLFPDYWKSPLFELLTATR
jgi:hypothetical protein